MEFRLGTLEDRFPNDSTLIDFQDILTKREFMAIQKAITDINEYKANKRLIEIVLLNNQEIELFFQQTFQSFLNKSVSWIGVKNEDIEYLFLHANRLLLNYLSSIRTYLDHSLTYLSKKFGNNSKQIIKFKALLSFNFDNNFCYRFFYKLRNYSQHCGVPIDNVNFTSKYDRDNKEIYGHLTALFKPEALLSNYDSWGNQVKRDLESMIENFELRELRESMTAIMFNINYNFEKINSSKTKKAAKYIFKKISHLHKPGKQLCLFHNIKTNDEGHLIHFDIIHLPIKEIEQILST